MFATPIWPLAIGAVAVPLAWLAGRLRSNGATLVFAAAAAGAFVATILSWTAGPSTATWPWVPSWDVDFALKLDGLAALFTLLITATGTAVAFYALGYMASHLAEHDQPPERQTSFSLWMLVFMTSMLGLVLADDLVVLFVFWELTTVASFFLIGFDGTERARWSARMALVITGVSAVLMLVGILVLYAEVDTFAIAALDPAALGEPVASVVAASIGVAALAKSAQVPLHFWLPRAMAAPTPVSAYLHSAAMVAAGVFVVARLYPVLTASASVAAVLPWVGVVSMLVGSLLALASDGLKQLLAYSTIAQYGYVVLLLGLGGAWGLVGAAFYVVVHGLAKASLFMVAGAVIEATGERELSAVGGLAGELPILAAVCGVAAASLAALPPTMGFFKDELLFEAALHAEPWFLGLSILGAGLTLAYLGKFFAGIFLGERRAEAESLPTTLWLAPASLSAILLVGGIWPAPFARLAERAAAPMGPPVDTVHLAYQLGLPTPYLAAFGAWTIGGLVWWFSTSRPGWFDRLAGDLPGVAPEWWYRQLLSLLEASSHRLSRLEERDLRSRLLAILVPAVVLVAAAFLAGARPLEFGEVRLGDLPLILSLATAVLTGFGLALADTTSHLTMVLGLTVLGFSLAAIFLLLGGPDVTLVAVLVELVLTIVMFGLLRLHPREALESATARASAESRHWGQVLVAAATGGIVGAVAWTMLSRPFPDQTASGAQLAQLGDATAIDAVAAVLSDFRALDTLGEITVVAVAAIGLAGILRGGRGHR